MLCIAAGTIFLLGVATPINFFLTTVISGLLALSGYLLLQQTKSESIPDVEEEEQSEGAAMKSPENVINLLNMDPIEFEFGYGLIPIVDASQGGDLLDRVVMISRQLAMELEFVILVVRIRVDILLKTNEYGLKIKGN